MPYKSDQHLLNCDSQLSPLPLLLATWCTCHQQSGLGPSGGQKQRMSPVTLWTEHVKPTCSMSQFHQ